MGKKMARVIWKAKNNVGDKHCLDVACLDLEEPDLREEVFREIVDVSIKECIERCMKEYGSTIKKPQPKNASEFDRGVLEGQKMMAFELAMKMRKEFGLPEDYQYKSLRVVDDSEEYLRAADRGARPRNWFYQFDAWEESE